MAKKVNWYCVVNSEGTTLAVYGSALGDMATAQARELAKLGPVALRLVATVRRPTVGAQAPKRYLSMAFGESA